MKKTLKESVRDINRMIVRIDHPVISEAPGDPPELKLTYNRTRQAAITKEILEIVGGAERQWPTHAILPLPHGLAPQVVPYQSFDCQINSSPHRG